MAVTIPSSDGENFALQAKIAAQQALVNSTTGSTLSRNIAMLDEYEMQLVLNIISNSMRRTPGSGKGNNDKPSYLMAHTILATCSINT